MTLYSNYIAVKNKFRLVSNIFCDTTLAFKARLPPLPQMCKNSPATLLVLMPNLVADHKKSPERGFSFIFIKTKKPPPTRETAA